MTHLLQVAALIFTLISSTGLSIALINVDCYSTFCSEEFFTFETRVHLTVFYAFLATSLCILLLRANSPTFRHIVNFHLFHELPLVGKRVTVGGLLTSLIIFVLVCCSTIYWLPAQNELWGHKTDPLNWATAKIQLTATGVTGHYADILLGLLLLPVSRNSLIGQAFSLHQSTLLFAHKAVSYLFSLIVVIHGVTYMLHVNDASRSENEARDEAFTTGNPSVTLSESKQRSIWFSITYYVGIAAILPVLIILATSIPWIRRRHYNLFYFSHIILGALILVASSLHASTNFYFLLPGLFLWIIDWIRRLFFGDASGLVSEVPATLEVAENGWLRVSLLPSKTFTGQPLSYYYLNFPSVSRLETHAFTAVSHPSNNGGPVFLIQPTAGKTEGRLKVEWTRKLQALAQHNTTTLRLDVRVEGQYRVPDPNFAFASHIICIVGGSGITGALSLAHWWLETDRPNSRFDLIWTVRQHESTRLAEWQYLEGMAKTVSGLGVRAHISSESGRLDAGQALRHALFARGSIALATQGQGWVYSSGPPALLSVTQRACVTMQREIKRGTRQGNEKNWSVGDLTWYMARWEL
ncbi:ferric reductase [Fusarium heterosporum]|uniref:Ferric reductase n=1 Tax=Fusarium heterosporum TaxID=42747 RepID=A0A8H5TEB9_FUSHE|nr:ferric reductase [Fusarium heterosporum]